MNDVVFDIETYPSVFTLAAEHAHLPLRWSFEISPWRNDSRAIVEWCQWLAQRGMRLVGFNSVGFDYPVLHTLLRMGHADAKTLYDKAMAIIQSGDNEDEGRWMHSVKPADRIVQQVDLFKIHHFDNRARSTSLKVLEFNMHMDDVSDLPFPVGTVLTQDQAEVLKVYNAHDVTATKRFYHESLDMIRFREEMCVKHPEKDWLNFNDTKIGKEYFTLRLEGAGVQCYDFGPEGRQPRQTRRASIALRDAILPWITFEQPEFQRVLGWLKEQEITETKGVFNDIVARVEGFDFVFGLGGIHGSVENQIVRSTDEVEVVDLDVTSYYPNLAIANNFHPAHLGNTFATIYRDLFEQRKKYPKKSAESAMLKLALNGVYGDSNNRFSVFYDPLYTMTITLNGQLLLCLLCEMMLKHVPGLSMVQVNTDGATFQVPRTSRPVFEQVREWWQTQTNLNLEEAAYSAMFVRDVNNYIAQFTDGRVKRKGAYEHDLEWHQNHSALVVPKIAEKVLLEGAPIRATVEQWPDIYDFMLRAKVPRSSKLVIEHGTEVAQLPNTTRYHIARDGGRLFKWMSPLKGKTEWRKIGVESGWNVRVCNDIRDADRAAVDHDYYIREVEKLCNILN